MTIMPDETTNEETVDVDTTSVEVVNEAVEPSDESAAEVVDEVTADSFGWDDWDGSFDAIPEPHRGWTQRVHERAMARAEAAERDAHEARRIFESLTEGSEDPRVAEFKTQIDELKGVSEREKAEMKAQLDEALEKASAYEAYYTSQQAEYVSNFKSKNDWIFDGGKVEALAEELLDDGFDPEHLPMLLRMPSQLRDAARDEVKTLKGVQGAGDKAIRLARAGTKIEFERNDDLVAGTDGAVPTATHQDKLPDDMNILDAAERFAEKHMRTRR